METITKGDTFNFNVCDKISTMEAVRFQGDEIVFNVTGLSDSSVEHNMKFNDVLSLVSSGLMKKL